MLFSASLPVAAMGGGLPAQVAKDIDAGYCRRALAQIQPLLAAHTQDADAQFQYGRALTCLGKADDAIATLKDAVALQPNNGVFHRGLGEAYGLKAQQGLADGATGMLGAMSLMKSARQEFETAAQRTPTDVDAHVDLAMYYIMVPGIMGGSYSKAHDEEAVIEKLDPIQGLQVRANEAGNKDDVATGATLLQQAVARDKTAGSLIALGLFYAEAKQYDDAFKAFHAAQAKDPKAYMAWYQIGKLAGLAKKDYPEGTEALQQYIAFGDSLPDNLPSLGFAHFRLGNIYEDQGLIAQAKDEYAAASALNAAVSDPQLAAKLKDAETRLK